MYHTWVSFTELLTVNKTILARCYGLKAFFFLILKSPVCSVLTLVSRERQLINKTVKHNNVFY